MGYQKPDPHLPYKQMWKKLSAEDPQEPVHAENQQHPRAAQDPDGSGAQLYAKIGEPVFTEGNLDPVEENAGEGEESVPTPVVEEPAVEGPVVEDPVVEDPVVESPVVEDPVGSKTDYWPTNPAASDWRRDVENWNMGGGSWSYEDHFGRTMPATKPSWVGQSWSENWWSRPEPEKKNDPVKVAKPTANPPILKKAPPPHMISSTAPAPVAPKVTISIHPAPPQEEAGPSDLSTHPKFTPGVAPTTPPKNPSVKASPKGYEVIQRRMGEMQKAKYLETHSKCVGTSPQTPKYKGDSLETFFSEYGFFLTR